MPPRLPFAAALSALAGLAAAPGAAQDAGASFVARFESGRLDPARWAVSDGWSNGDHQLCGWSADRATVSDGALTLSLARMPEAGKPHACAEIQTRARYGYGVYEARIAPASAPGVVSAFFTYLGPVHGAPHDEIDVEFLGKDAGSVQLNLYVDGQGGRESFADLDGPPGAAHDVAFEWTEDAVRWWVDGEMVRESTRADGPLPSPPAKIYLSLWNGGNVGWLGRFEPASLPLTMRVERLAYTAPGDPCPFKGSVACRAAREGG